MISTISTSLSSETRKGWSKTSLIVLITASFLACGGGGSSSNSSAPAATPTASYGMFRQLKSVTNSDSGAVLGAKGAAYVAPALSSGQTVTMSTPRVDSSATLLADGTVLVAGGVLTDNFIPVQGNDSSWINSGLAFVPVNTVEIFNPATETFSAGPGNLAVPRWGQAALRMGSSGILFIGGDKLSGSQTNQTVELYDWALGQSRVVGTLPGPDLNDYAVFDAVAYNLGNGNIVVMPSSRCSFMFNPIFFNVAEFNDNSQVMGTTVPFDPNQVNAINPSQPYYTFAGPGSCQLQDGTVLMSGGAVMDNTTGTVSPIRKFDPVSGTFQVVGNLNTPRVGHAMVDLGNGLVAIMGGQEWKDYSTLIDVTSVEVFDVNTGICTTVGNMPGVKYMQQYGLLQNGFVLNAGGGSSSQQSGIFEWSAAEVTASQMVFNPFSYATGYTGDMVTPRAWFSMVPLDNGLYFLVGGLDSNGHALASAEIYDPLDQIYLSDPNPSLPYQGTETITATAMSGVTVIGTPVWTAVNGQVALDPTGLLCTYTFPAQPAQVNGTQPIIASDTITMAATVKGASGSSFQTTTTIGINLQQ